MYISLVCKSDGGFPATCGNPADVLSRGDFQPIGAWRALNRFVFHLWPPERTKISESPPTSQQKKGSRDSRKSDGGVSSRRNQRRI